MITRNLIACGLLLASASWAAVAQAEQGCPDGQAPIGRQPGPICVPQPGYGVGGPSPIQQRPNVRQPRWLDRWGAIAIDGVAQKMGTAADKSSSRDAKNAALKDCQTRGGSAQECKKTLLVYRNGCAAVALGADFVATSSAGSIEEASERAQKDCNANSTNCEVLYTPCSFAVLVD